ncbi:PTS fructose transporter subunit IIA [Photobacterium angustum]|uniref:PTS fructose transporter subunit IIA n=1 Tax=Photobacterium angustum TaxID=661 RepID=A0A855SAY7_PHOAN|nr:PTS sugar transporter subunit IIA [Photobacterium angustum]KJF81088.1 PTS fructose transporter subunit IIA [Photobacterium damselae subsp. damselae]KJG33393.1 PTS fructose transporter subunit IIA [Photobacterium angustum]KJG41519.1 PTS fructose transporter subunit IIA [Photobacterium angustum]KJG44568.1 PTS fructose transporter subunit IIA [Photobacterium angustum]KJG49448.1 PTS fructose transporter subunit IIA [Photobacterium angustum]
MLERRLTFYCGHTGLPLIQLDKLKKLASYFTSDVQVFNLQLLRSESVTKPLHVSTLASKPYQLCQLVITGVDAELALLVLTDFIHEYACPLLLPSSDSKGNRILKQRMAMLDFPLSFITPKQIQVNNKAQLLATMTRSLVDEKVIKVDDYQEVLAAIEKRESISATVMGNGIAMPHVMIDPIIQPAMVISCCQKMDWYSARGDVSKVLMMVLPKPLSRSVLMAFSRFSKQLLQDRYADALRQASDSNVIQALIIEAMLASD